MTRLRHILVLTIFALLTAENALGCAVCFGDPDSDMAKSAVRGVLFMVGVTGVMLSGIAGIAIAWVVRARRLGRNEDQTA